MKSQTSIVFLITLLIFTNCKVKKNISVISQSPEKWVSLFNGKDLNDWTIKIKGHPVGENYKNTFSVENGVMKVSYEEYENFEASYGHIFYNKLFTNYKLRMQYRFTGNQIKGGAGWAERNSGVMILSQSPESMDLNQNFPLSIEVQMLGGINQNKERPTGNLCTPGTNVVMDGKLFTPHCINSSSKTFYGEQWVTLEVIVTNDSIVHKINGEKVLSYTMPQIGGNLNEFNSSWKAKEGELLKSGFISLQSESHPVEFKNIEILELK